MIVAAVGFVWLSVEYSTTTPNTGWLWRYAYLFVTPLLVIALADGSTRLSTLCLVVGMTPSAYVGFNELMGKSVKISLMSWIVNDEQGVFVYVFGITLILSLSMLINVVSTTRQTTSGRSAVSESSSMLLVITAAVIAVFQLISSVDEGKTIRLTQFAPEIALILCSASTAIVRRVLIARQLNVLHWHHRSAVAQP